MQFPLYSWRTPFCMEYTSLIDPFISVSAKKVTLGLGQIGRQPGAAINVKIGQGDHQGGYW